MASNPPYSLRLTFAYRGTQISLVGVERIAMIVPASIEEPADAATSGYSFALLDADGHVIYRRPLHNPIRIDAEAFSPGKGRPIERVPLSANEGRFTVLVPDLPDARGFRLSGPTDPARAHEPARELLHLDVDSLRRSVVSVQPTGTPPGQRPGG
ncbi:MAG TPA: hypothetical protein VJ891_11020 [Casimicrobiaceae bacterium]|nr:hypothetical protein [Casimicrobiaceae bacterium]